MKVPFFIIFILFFLGCSNMNRNNIYLKINDIDIKKYEGKEVSEFLKEINEEYFKYYFIQEPPLRLIGCMFMFNNYSVFIYISTYNYVERFNNEGKWDIDDFMKEKILKIEIERLRRNRQIKR